MKKLTTQTLPAFCAQTQPVFILFGSPEGETTMRQALEFAESWADHAGEAAYGYVDAFENIAAARAHGVRVLPTTLLIENGAVTRKFEGVHTSAHFAAALFAPAQAIAA